MNDDKSHKKMSYIYKYQFDPWPINAWFINVRGSLGRKYYCGQRYYSHNNYMLCVLTNAIISEHCLQIWVYGSVAW